MKQNLSGGVIVIVLLLAIVVIGFFGYRYLNGGPNADITASRIQYYREKAARAAGGSNALPLNAPVPRGSQTQPVAPGTR
ncbi:MAG TPA: hypothetical protein VFB21_13630 [Chthonomonadaceae bacterium]|nr:hypothetical protein [Chthonomonadaceae bacterium]